MPNKRLGLTLFVLQLRELVGICIQQDVTKRPEVGYVYQVSKRMYAHLVQKKTEEQAALAAQQKLAEQRQMSASAPAGGATVLSPTEPMDVEPTDAEVEAAARMES